MNQLSDGRRGFRRRVLAASGLAAAAPMPAPAQSGASNGKPGYLPKYALAQNYTSLKQSSFDRSGGNQDYWPMKAGETREVLRADGPGVITHVWFTIAARSEEHLKELLL